MSEEFCLYCEEDLYGDWLTTEDGEFCNHSHAKHWKDKQRISDLERRNGELIKALEHIEELGRNGAGLQCSMFAFSMLELTRTKEQK